MNKTETTAGYIVSLDDFLKAKEQKQKELLEDFVFESNWIEGISMYDRIATINVGEELPPYYEFLDHHKALRYVLDRYQKGDPSEQDIKHLHRLLTENIFRESAQDLISRNELSQEDQDKVLNHYDKNSGNYRQSKVWIGSSRTGYQGTPYYRQIPKLMKGLEKDIKQLTNPIDKEIWTIHNKFETIHPFVDGNGRAGRLLLNWLSLRYLNEFIINQGDKRGEYYDIIRAYKPKFKQQNPKVHFYKDLPPRRTDEYQFYAALMNANKKPFFD